MKKNLIFIIIILGLVLSLSVFFVSKNQPQDGVLLKESQIENPSTNEDQIEEITKTFDLQHLNEILKNVPPLKEVSLEQVLKDEMFSSLQCSPYSGFLIKGSCSPRYKYNDLIIDEESFKIIAKYLTCHEGNDYSSFYVLYDKNDQPSLICSIPAQYEIVHGSLGRGDFRNQFVQLSENSLPSLVFIVYNTETQKYHLVFNNQLSKPYDGLDFLTVSPNKKHLAYGVKENDKWYMILDGKRSGPFDEIHYQYHPDGPITDDPIEDVVFSPNSKIFAYFTTTDGQMSLRLNFQNIEFEREESNLDNIKFANGTVLFPRGEAIKFSPDSQKIALIIKSQQEGRNRSFVISNNYFSNPCPYDDSLEVFFTPDSKYLVQVVSQDQKTSIFLNNQEVKTVTYNYPLSLLGGRLALFLKLNSLEGDEYYLIKQNGETKIFLLSNYSLQDFSEKIVYLIQENEKVYSIVVNNQKIDQLDFSVFYDKYKEDADIVLYFFRSNGIFYRYLPRLSKDGQKIVYPVIENNQLFIKENGQKIASLGKATEVEIMTMVISPDAHRLAVITSFENDLKSRWDLNIFADGNLLATYSNDSPYHYDTDQLIFSPDSQHIAYLVSKGNGKTLMVDGQEIAHYSMFYNFKFSEDNQKIIYLALKDNLVIREEKDLK